MITTQEKDDIIKSNNVIKLKDYLKKNNISLLELNETNFDVLIEAIENEAFDIIKFIIQKGYYKTLNYTVIYRKPSDSDKPVVYYKTPLFSAINFELYDIADFLIRNCADINYSIEIDGKKIYLLYYLCRYNILDCTLSLNKLKYILNRGYNLNGITDDLINYLISQSENDLLSIIFRYYIFDISFILNLITLNKHKISMSKENFQELLKKEKNKIRIEEEMYREALKGPYDLRFKTISKLFEYDCRETKKVQDTILKYKILEKAVKNYNYGYTLIKEILNNKNWSHIITSNETSLSEALKTENKDIVDLFIEKLKERLFTFKDININKIIIASIKNTPNDIIIYFLEACQTIKDIEITKMLDFEAILIKACQKSDVPLIDYIFTILPAELYNTIDLEHIFKESCQNPKGKDIIKYMMNLLYDTNDQFTMNRMTFYDNILLEASKKRKDEIIKAIINTLLERKKAVMKNETFEELFINSYSSGSIDLMKYLNESLIQSNIINRSTINFEKILLETSRKHYNVDKERMEYILEIVFNHSLNDNIETMDLNFLEHEDESFLILLINIFIKIQNVKLIKRFIENKDLKLKLNINTKDKNSNSPILTAYLDYINNDKTIEINIFNYLLQQNADCNTVDRFGSHLLLLALKDKKYLKINLLLKQEKLKLFDINFSKKQDRHPIIQAIFQDDEQKIKQILTESENDYNKIDQASAVSFPFTPLILSYLLNAQKIFQYLVQHFDINRLDDCGYNLLHYAILKEDISSVAYLVQHGAYVNYYKGEKNCGNSALDIAISIKNQEIIDIIFSSQKLLLNIPNHLDETPIITVIKNYRYSEEEKIVLIKKLVDNGADINFTNSYENFPLLYAIYEKSLSLVQLFIDMGVDVNLHDDNSPLISAVEAKSCPIMQLLLDNDADVNFVNQSGFTALVYSMETNNLPLVKLLVEHGANINEIIENEYGQEITILNLAIIIGDMEIIHYLMENNAEISFENDYSYYDLISDIHHNGKIELFKDLANYNLNQFSSQLFLTIIYGNIQWNKLELLKILVDLQFDMNVKDVNGNTPLVYAIKVSDGPIANFLIDHGASLNETNNYGDSIYDLSYRSSDSYWGRIIYNRIKTILQK